MAEAEVDNKSLVGYLIILACSAFTSLDPTTELLHTPGTRFHLLVTL